jgi:hypothetical protein
MGNKKNKHKSVVDKEALTSTLQDGHEKKRQGKMLYPCCSIFHMKVISSTVLWIRH